MALTNGVNIIGLLSMPEFTRNDGTPVSYPRFCITVVTAIMSSPMSGP